MDQWAGFFDASTGASATLSGMLIVAISINLTRILSVPRLPDRAAGALIPLAGVLALALLALIPGQLYAVFGGEVLAAAAVIWLLDALMVARSRPGPTGPASPPLWPRVVLTQLQTLPFVIAGVLMMMLDSPTGLYWMAAGVIISLVVGMGASDRDSAVAGAIPSRPGAPIRPLGERPSGTEK